MAGGDIPVQDEFLDSLLSDFMDESAQILGNLNDNLLDVEDWIATLNEGQIERCDDDLMTEMFRGAHSIKGLSAMLGLTDINQLTHNIENVFDAARNDQLQLDPIAVGLLFKSLDHLEAMVARLANHSLPEISYSETLDDIQELLSGSGSLKQQQSQADAENALSDLLDEKPTNETISEPESNLLDSISLATHEISGENSCPQDATPIPFEDLLAGIVDTDDPPSKYLSIFIDETELSLETLSELLLAAEGQEAEQDSEDLLITSHRIKGSAATVGLNRPAKLAHYMEDVLQELREKDLPLKHTVADALLKCTDGLRDYIEGLKAGDSRPDDFPKLAHGLLLARQATSPEKPNNNTPQSVQACPGDSPESTPLMSGDSTGFALRQDDILNSAPGDTQGLIGAVEFNKDLPLSIIKGRLLHEKLCQAGEVFYCQPDLYDVDESESLASFEFGVATSTSLDEVQELLNIGGVASVLLKEYCETEHDKDHPQTTDNSSQDSPESKAPNRPETNPQSPASASAPEAPVTSKKRSDKNKDPKPEPPKPKANKPAETLRVEIDRLDQLMNLAGQLVINKARFSQLGERLRSLDHSKHTSRVMKQVSGDMAKVLNRLDSCEEDNMPSSELTVIRDYVVRLQSNIVNVQRDVDQFAQSSQDVAELFEAIHQLDRVTDGIQKSVMDTRMVSIGPLFTRFKRVIRDITRANGKSIDLVIQGEKTELDKRMIDELSDPLIHMVRNSADHGIEAPEDRERAGKSRRGTVTLEAFHRGNSIVVQVSDDGQGIDPERIRDKAIEKGIVTKADADRMTPYQLYQLVWEPGFSTAEKVTDISGRGMGMDIVRSKIEDINGTVTLDSVPGEGATFTIKLPLTMAILPSLMTRIDGDIFALPIESVVEIVGVEPSVFSTIHRKQMATVRGRVISVVSLSDVFSWNSSTTRVSTAQVRTDDETTIVVVGDGQKELGIIVDEVVGEEDIVIKSMAENFCNVEGVAGASILGNGCVSLIVDVATLMVMAATNTPRIGEPTQTESSDYKSLDNDESEIPALNAPVVVSKATKSLGEANPKDTELVV